MIADVLIDSALDGFNIDCTIGAFSGYIDEQEVTPEILQSFLVKDNLNSTVWLPGQRMIPAIREHLLSIANTFFKQLDIEEDTLKDITLTGSIANYNWSNFSDIDLHLRVDFKAIDKNINLVRKYMLSQKNLWNEQHKIDIEGIPVELYVENIGDTHIASGLYSIKNDKWIVKPKMKQLIIDLDDVKSKADSFVSVLDHVRTYIDKEDYASALSVIEDTKIKLKKLRASGLEHGGEFSVENLAFKSLRRSGFIEQLNNLANMVIAHGN